MPAGTAVAIVAKKFDRISSHAPYAPTRPPNAMRIHEYEEPAFGATRESCANATAMQSIIAETESSESGAKAPAAATIGPIVDARLYAGPMEADDSTEISKNFKTRGSDFVIAERGLRQLYDARL